MAVIKKRKGEVVPEIALWKSKPSHCCLYPGVVGQSQVRPPQGMKA